MKWNRYTKFLLGGSCLIVFTNLASQTDFNYTFLADEYENFRYSMIPARNLRIEHVVEMLGDLKKQFPDVFQYDTLGQSVQKRPVYLVRLGTGPTKILLWSQMHGDEPTATAALFDVFYYLMKNGEQPFVRDILEKTTLLAVPMLNPDGAEKFTRRNAQGLDVNRDARDRQSPEGQLLFHLKETYKPEFGFNLHDQNARITVGKTHQLAALALMAPPFDSDNNDNPVRIRAKKIVSVIYRALGPFLYGHISKYNADYMPRSFGDSMQDWGVSTVLIESGGWYQNRYEFLQKMNFIALMASFHAIATGNYEQANPALYDLLPENGRRLYDLLIKNVTVMDGTGIPPFRTDVAVNFDNEHIGRIADMGDLDIYTAREIIPGEDYCLTPGFVGVLPDIKIEARVLKEPMMSMIEKGFTTLLICTPLETMNRKIQLNDSLALDSYPGNLGELVYVDKALSSPIDTLQVLKYAGGNIIGIMGDGNMLQREDFAKYTKKPTVLMSDVHIEKELHSVDAQQIKRFTMDQSEQWKIPQRGKIRIGQIADMVFFVQSPPSKLSVHTVFVAGHPVWREGSWLDAPVKGERWFYHEK